MCKGKNPLQPRTLCCRKEESESSMSGEDAEADDDSDDDGGDDGVSSGEGEEEDVGRRRFVACFVLWLTETAFFKTWITAHSGLPFLNYTDQDFLSLLIALIIHFCLLSCSLTVLHMV